ncbi:MAG TPA: anti-sigma factor, partial [Propionibacteriaceae bacterium]|nr:anti-sigma factor [Propionibacteriaceae bacterium]
MSEIHGAVGSYVVNALDPDELDEFEAHLAVCPTCTREVQEFGETAAQLSLLASATPPPALRTSILAAISEVRPLPPEPSAETAAPEPSPRVTLPAPAPRRPVDELALRRQQRRTRVLSVLVAAVVAAALALGGVVYGLVNARQAQVAQQAAETELLTAPDVKTYSATMKDGGQISFVVSKSLNRAMFVGKGLPAVGADRTYQLWTLEGQRAIPDNTVPGGGDRKEFFRETLSGVTGLAVSVEAAGGVQQPTPAA